MQLSHPSHVVFEDSQDIKENSNIVKPLNCNKVGKLFFRCPFFFTRKVKMSMMGMLMVQAETEH